MKSNQTILFILTCILLYFTDFTGSTLICLFLFFQINLDLEKIKLSKKSQLFAIKLFFLSIPLFWLYGAVHSFAIVYLKENQFFYFFIISLFLITLNYLIIFSCFYTYKFLIESEFNLNQCLLIAFNKQKYNFKLIGLTGLFLYLISLNPFFASDWKIIFSLFISKIIYQRLNSMAALA